MAPQTKETLEILGRQIAMLRKSLNLTQEELADKAGISRQTMRMIESGSQNLTIDTMIKIGNATGMILDISYQQLK